MNSLSWFIYLADILGNVSGVLTTFAVLGILSGAFGILVGKFVVWDTRGHTDSKKEELANSRTLIGNYGLRFFVLGMIFAFVAMIIPSSKSMYMIAGSEIGETVVTHPETVEVYHEVRDIILDKLREYNIKEDIKKAD